MPTFPHQKSMGSYELYAWRDAMALASWLEEQFDVREVGRAFLKLTIQEKLNFESRNEEFILELIRRTEAQRPAYLRNIGKDATDTTKGLLIVFAVLGQIRVKEMLELRDRFREALVPGGANRAICSAMYTFQYEASRLGNYDWPNEVFDAYGSEAGNLEDEE